MKKLWKKYLSKMQRTVLLDLSRGWTNKEIAHRLGLSVYTVNTYCKRICQKLGAKNIKHAIRIATRLGLL